MEILTKLKRKFTNSSVLLEKEYKKNLSYAKKIQMSLILKEFPKSDKFEFYGTYLPAETLGGDIFDIKQLDDQYFAFYIADVAGHGIASAMLTVFVKQSIEMTSTVLRQNIINSPKQVLDKLNKKLLETNFEGNPQVTMFYSILDIKMLSLVYSSAGHHPSVIIRKDKSEPILIGKPSLPLGWFKKIHLYENNTELQKGDKVILFTDGLFETIRETNYDKSFNNLIEIIKENRNLPIRKLINKIISIRKKSEEDSQQDDIAVLGVEIN